MIQANVQSLGNKTDELQANVTHFGEFREACIMALTDMDTDSALDIESFGTPLRLDLDCEGSRNGEASACILTADGAAIFQ